MTFNSAAQQAAIRAVLIGALFALVANARADADAGAPIDPGQYDHPVKVACVGDSITAGSRTSQGKPTSWAGDLGRMLGEHWSVGNFGSSGRTLLNKGDFPYQTKGALKAALKFQPDVVIIMLGTNDTKPQNWIHKDEFIADYKDLIGKFQNLPTHPRFFACYPPFVPGTGNYGINEAGVLEEIPMIDQVAGDEKTGIIDMHAPTKQHPELLPDRVHPDDQGQALMAKVIYKSLVGKEFEGDVPPPPPKATSQPAK